MKWPNATICNEKYSILNYFCDAEFLAYCRLETKASKTYDYQSDDNLIEKKHEECSYPPIIKLMISGETMQCRKVRRILRYHVPNKLSAPEKFAAFGLSVHR